MKFKLCGQTPNIGSKHCIDYEVDEDDILIHLGKDPEEDSIDDVDPDRIIDAVSDFVVDQGDAIRVCEWSIERA